ncbi:hypothetical protein DPMN_038866 [Dreissena polymorpha]|uniref:Uncharacterized protein n=1 Tax=Dreissena polymorpha TaxID=45954 RepID=A0A9D4RR54_DREPO|nr:hypothetical protein DPMN_038866 [Dreissena polymorpha]
MDLILEGLAVKEGVIQRFRQEKIALDIISFNMSLYDFNCLGVNDKTTIMKLRVECVCYRSDPW